MMQYVSSIIGNDYERWTYGDNILISTPTGSGKTFFIFDVLFPYARQHGKSLVYLCNRILLEKQILELTDKIQPNELSDEFPLGYVDPSSHKPRIFIYTYHKFENNHNYADLFYNRNNIYPSIIDSDIAYYVFDESHYFLYDSVFNRNTNFWYEYFRNIFKSVKDRKKIFIFLTSTPDELILFLSQVLSERTVVENLEISYSTFKRDKRWEKQQNKILSNSNDYLSDSSPYYLDNNYYEENEDINDKDIPDDKKEDSLDFFRDYLPDIWKQILNTIPDAEKKLKTYYAPADYSNLKIFYFLKFDEIIARISSGDPSEKWLIFVKNKEEGRQLASDINYAYSNQKIAVFLNSNSKSGSNIDRKTFDEISKREQFSRRVLVTTKVLDNGINIKDSRLLHIVIDCIEKSSFIQMLGRKRYTGQRQPINLYLRVPTAKQIHGFCRRYDQILRNSIHFIQLNRRTNYRAALSPSKALREVQRTNSKISKILRDFKNGDSALVLNKKAPEEYRMDYPGNDSKNWNEPKNKEIIQRHLRNFKLSDTALLKVIQSYYFLDEALALHRETGDPYFFLKIQLEWINHTYDETCWLDSQRDYVEKELNRIAEAEIPLDSDRLGKLAYDYLEWLCDSPKPPIRYKKRRAEYQRQIRAGKTLKVATLNHGLEDAGLPYFIESKQRWDKSQNKKIRVYYVRQRSNDVCAADSNGQLKKNTDIQKQQHSLLISLYNSETNPNFSEHDKKELEDLIKIRHQQFHNELLRRIKDNDL